MAEQIFEIERASPLPHPSGCEQSPCLLAADIRLKKWEYRRLAHDSNGTVPCVGSAELHACRRWPNSMATIIKIHNSHSVISLKQAYLKSLTLRTAYVFGKLLIKTKVKVQHRWNCQRGFKVDSSWNVMAHGDAREGKWRGNWRTEWVASTLHTTSEHGVSSITTADAHTSAVSSRLNWRPRRFKWTRPFRRKTKSGFCACAITFQLASTLCRA